MLRTKSLRAVFALPAALAVAFMGFSNFAFADAESERLALDAKLREFAFQEGKLTSVSTPAQIAAVNTATATADDLVFAVYELAQAAGDNPAKIADIAAGALLAQPLAPGAAATTAKVRADKDKVVGRVLEAAVVASIPNITSGNRDDVVTQLLQRVSTVNSTLPATKQLTLAGKQLLVAKALRSTTGLGTEIAVTSKDFVPMGTTIAATDTARTAFHVGVLKLLAYKPITNDPALALPTKGTYFPIRDGVQMGVTGEPAFIEGTPPSIFSVQEYVDRALDEYIQLDHKVAAVNIATGVAATVPAAAGAAIAGYVKDKQTAQSQFSNQQILDELKGTTPATSIVANTKLAAAVSDIVADTFRLFKGNGATVNDVVALATSQTGAGTVAISAALKGKIASGAIRVKPADAGLIVTRILEVQDGAGKMVPLTAAGIASFAGAAAQGVDGASGAAITTAAVDKITYVQPTGATPTQAAITAAIKADNTKVQAVAIAVGKSLALVDPNAMTAVAESLFTGSRGGRPNPYSLTGTPGQESRQILAADLAKGLATNYAAAGAAVSGVVRQALLKNVPTDQDDALIQIAAISGAAIKAAPKAAVNIALKIASNVNIRPSFQSKSFADLAAALVTNLNVAATNAGAVAAGVALADTANAGVITAAVINAGAPLPNTAPSAPYNARQAAALSIANTVAINVDVEAIGLIAQSVGALLQPTVSSSKLPKISSVSALTTSLAKAINLKPLVSWANRVDELGELAAEMTKQYLANAAVPDGTDLNATATANEMKLLASGLASIGTSILKAASAKLLANTLNNAADVRDIAENVSGAIAQAIANSTKLAASAKDILLTDKTTTGSLIKLLTTAATASKSTLLVTAAFDNVAGTKVNGVYGNYESSVSGENVTRADSTTGRYETGVNYEVGAVVGAETPVKNI